MKTLTLVPDKTAPREVTLHEQVLSAMREKNYSARTEQAYTLWIKRFVLFHNRKDPRGHGRAQIDEYLTYLAQRRKLSASTVNQAFHAIMFLYSEVLHMPVSDPDTAARAKKPLRLPVIFSHDEAGRVIAAMSGTYQLMAKLLYGSGLRLAECVALRVKDIDFKGRRIVVRDASGSKDRITLLPDSAVQPLKDHMERIRILHESDIKSGYGSVYLPDSLLMKHPQASKEWGWQYVFQAPSLSEDPHSGQIVRHHVHKNSLQKAVKQAIRLSGIDKQAGGCHTFRHSFAVRLVEAGHDIRTVQNLLGHKDVNTTMVYTHLADRKETTLISPVDE